jgi:Tannase-like family of unknown function (DUF6351)
MEARMISEFKRMISEFKSKRFLSSLLGSMLCAVLGTCVAPVSAQPQSAVPHDFTITVLSSSPDTVTAGDALIRIEVPRVVPMAKVTVLLNGGDITAKFRRDDLARTLTGLVDGLELGQNHLFVDSNGRGAGRPIAELTLVNHPKDGPVFSGPYQTPFVCEAHKFMVPAFGAVLEEAAPPECSVPRRVDYFYRTTSGAFTAWPFQVDLLEAPLPKEQRVYPPGLSTTTISLGLETPAEVPYIVRVETGSANRGLYNIWVLHDPYDAQPTFYAPPKGWNKRFFYGFGGGCSSGWYHQGTTAGLTMSGTNPTPARLADFPLSRGYAIGVSSLNVNGINCHDVIAAEAMMTVKERMIETFGPPKFTMGTGTSGGAVQQHMIVDNYPGLLDGFVPASSYPDNLFSLLRVAYDATLLDSYFKTMTVGWSLEQKRAVTGFGDYASATNPSGMPEGTRTISVRGFCPPELPASSLYDPIDNPTGTRCDIFSAYANVFGTDPVTGFTRRAFDNVGVQYGLAALNSKVITAAQFVDLNAKVGGFDIDGNPVPTRTVGDLTAVRLAYQTGRVTNGGGGLASIPIIDYRSYSDTTVPGGDHHLSFNSSSMRERLIKANGHAANHIMLVERLRTAAGGLLQFAPLQSGLLAWALETMDRWLTLIADDTSDRPQIVKVLDARDALQLSDGCHRPTRPLLPYVIEGPEVVNAAECLGFYPVFSFPRGVAGEGVANDVIKCQLKAINWADYNVTDPADLALLQAELPNIFSTGVCDYSKPGIEQQPPLGTWLDYGSD